MDKNDLKSIQNLKLLPKISPQIPIRYKTVGSNRNYNKSKHIVNIWSDEFKIIWFQNNKMDLSKHANVWRQITDCKIDKTK